eukprot:4100540-Ditylum_brightwellii.AAC.1
MPKNKKKGAQEKFGIQIPWYAREALLLDKENKNNNWVEAILKEMSVLDQLNVFKYHNPNTVFSK